jgi:hypothetical protein
MTRLLLICALLLSLTGPTEAGCPKVQRSAAVVRTFRKGHPCPSTGKTTGPCPGWVVDHGLSLCLTGPQGDVPWNLYWQEKAASLEKDKLEQALCRKLCACLKS